MQKTAPDDLAIAPTATEGNVVVRKKNPHIGSSFESWLDEAGIREDVTVAAIKAVIARQLADEMKKMPDRRFRCVRNDEGRA
jgi:hypothetical protein